MRCSFGVDTIGARALFLSLAAGLSGCTEPSDPPSDSEPADLVLVSGVIYPMDAVNAPFEAMAIRSGAIVLTGTDNQVSDLIGDNTQVVSLQGRTVLPGFHDAHTHLIWSAVDLLNVDLFSVTTVEEFQSTVGAWATANPSAPWVQGGGWDMSIFDGLLHKSLVDEVVPDRPAFLYSADGHSALANSKALQIAGITAATPDPEDGIIERDEAGEPTGMLLESAMSLVSQHIPPYPEDQVSEGLAAGLLEARSFGITTLVDANVAEWMLAGYAAAAATGTLTVRVFGAVEVFPGDTEAAVQIQSLQDAYGSDRVSVSQGKLYLDGIIESQTAYMLEPYVDGTNGSPNFSNQELQDALIALDDAGIQIHAHAIGDGAVRQILDALDFLSEVRGGQDRRPLIAHLEVIDPDDIPRFASIGAFADFQPLWAYPDPYIVDLTWPVIGPERSEWLYPMGAVLDAGGTVVAGSDWSVSSMNVFEAIEVAVLRQDPWEDGGEVLTPQHRITLTDILRAYTSVGALATFSEDRLGSLEVGKEADFIVLDRDPFLIDPVELSDVVVQETWVGGVRVYDQTTQAYGSAPRRSQRDLCLHPHRTAK